MDMPVLSLGVFFNRHCFTCLWWDSLLVDLYFLFNTGYVLLKLFFAIVAFSVCFLNCVTLGNSWRSV